MTVKDRGISRVKSEMRDFGGRCGVWVQGWCFTSSKNCWVRRRMCFSSVNSRKFFFRASWLVLISFSSFSSFSNVAYQTKGNAH